MNDKELADRVVALGVGRFEFDRYYVRNPDGDVAQPHEWRTIAGFVRDWLVAGALMEKVWVDICHNTPEFLDFVNSRINGKSIHELPRAIIEACVEALTEDER